MGKTGEWLTAASEDENPYADFRKNPYAFLRKILRKNIKQKKDKIKSLKINTNQ